jgi:putative tricarboxylic transport membrane protein
MPRSSLKTWLRFDPMVALLTIPIAIFLIIVELDTPVANIPQMVGPAAMPIGVLALLIINAIFLFIQSTSGKNASASSAAGESVAPPLPWIKKYRGIILVILGLIIYGLILVPIGFILATSFLIIYEARVLQPGRWIRNVILGVGSSALAYFTFVKLLNVMLPAGILG